jgi:hypothetical protein
MAIICNSDYADVNGMQVADSGVLKGKPEIWGWEKATMCNLPKKKGLASVS